LIVVGVKVPSAATLITAIVAAGVAAPAGTALTAYESRGWAEKRYKTIESGVPPEGLAARKKPTYGPFTPTVAAVSIAVTATGIILVLAGGKKAAAVGIPMIAGGVALAAGGASAGVTVNAGAEVLEAKFGDQIPKQIAESGDTTP
jgi:hypothetical protein